MKIAVLAGGISTERDVSLVSGAQIYRALKKNGHDVILIDVFLGFSMSEEEKTYPLSKFYSLDKDWAENIKGVNEENPDIETVKALRKDWEKCFFGPNVLELCREADIVFMALHGENGENGKIQACFDLMGIRYTGTDNVSSAMCMDKGITKDLFKAYDIPTPWGIRVKRNVFAELNRENLKFPLFVKACCGGSSIGCAIAKDREEFEDAAAEAFKYDNEVIIEQFIKGREFSIGVMEGEAMPVIEIAPLVGFYDYKNKYQAGATVETCPAVLDEVISKKMQACAEKVFRVMRLKCYARMDFMLDERTNEFYCLEANTLPGMTPTSLVPQEAAVLGISFEQLCERIVEAGMKK